MSRRTLLFETCRISVTAGCNLVKTLIFPGWGRTTDMIDRSQEKLFLKPFFESIHMERPVIIAASYGGNYAIPYIMEPDAGTCHNRARGFVPIATTSTGRYKAAQYHRCDVSIKCLMEKQNCTRNYSLRSKLLQDCHQRIVFYFNVTVKQMCHCH